MDHEQNESARAGLCATCEHAAVIVSDRGSRFYRCDRAAADPRFRKYPPLPVIACIGYDERACTPSSPRE